MLKLSPPERFDFYKLLDWPDWKQNFLRFKLATKLHKEDGDVQVSTLVYTMGRKAEHVYKSFTLAEGDEKKFDVIYWQSLMSISFQSGTYFTSEHVFTKGTKDKERRSYPSFEAFMR